MWTEPAGEVLERRGCLRATELGAAAQQIEVGTFRTLDAIGPAVAGSPPSEGQHARMCKGASAGPGGQHGVPFGFAPLARHTAAPGSTSAARRNSATRRLKHFRRRPLPSHTRITLSLYQKPRREICL
jgi:hypothetical protein